jgi:ABC-2 type transport system permease protein
VYVINETTFQNLDFSPLLQDEFLGHITFEVSQVPFDTITKRIEESEDTSVLLRLSENDSMFSLDLVKSSKGSVNDSSLKKLGEAILKSFHILKIKAMGITPEQSAFLDTKVSTSLTLTDAEGNPIVKEDTSISNSEYWFVYGLLFIIMMVNIMASTQIATAIATDKSTRVVEYLLTSVRPLALMVGKVLAMLVAVLAQLITFAIMIFISNKVFSSGSANGNALAQFLPQDIFKNLNIINIFLCLLMVALGLIFYGILAGIAGATVSKLEEIQEGLTLFTITNLVGVYIGLGAANTMMISGTNTYVMFSLLFPLSSPFLLPGAILVGKTSMGVVAIAVALQLVFTILLFKFAAKIYEALILHNGNTIKPKDLFKLSKTV